MYDLAGMIGFISCGNYIEARKEKKDFVQCSWVELSVKNFVNVKLLSNTKTKSDETLNWIGSATYVAMLICRFIIC